MNGFLEKLSLQELQDLVGSERQGETSEDNLMQEKPMTLLPPLPLLPHHHPLSRPLDAWMQWSQSAHQEHSKRLDVSYLCLSMELFHDGSLFVKKTIERYLERQNQWQNEMLEQTRMQTELMQSLLQESRNREAIRIPSEYPLTMHDKNPQEIRFRKSSSTLVDTPWLPDTPAPLVADTSEESLPIRNPPNQPCNEEKSEIKPQEMGETLTPMTTPTRTSVRSLRQRAPRAPPLPLMLETNGDSIMQEGSVDESFFS
jgi:hypothetical protein